jgi:hypothetical protein
MMPHVLFGPNNNIAVVVVVVVVDITTTSIITKLIEFGCFNIIHYQGISNYYSFIIC